MRSPVTQRPNTRISEGANRKCTESLDHSRSVIGKSHRRLNSIVARGQLQLPWTRRTGLTLVDRPSPRRASIVPPV